MLPLIINVVYRCALHIPTEHGALPISNCESRKMTCRSLLASGAKQKLVQYYLINQTKYLCKCQLSNINLFICSVKLYQEYLAKYMGLSLVSDR